MKKLKEQLKVKTKTISEFIKELPSAASYVLRH